MSDNMGNSDMLDQDRICQDYSSRQRASIDGVMFLIHCYTFKMVTMASASLLLPHMQHCPPAACYPTTEHVSAVSNL